MTNYVVIEMQHNANGTTAILPPDAFEDRNEAEAKYHTVLAAAAVSKVFDHVCTMLDREGHTIKSEHFPHGQSEFPEATEGGES